MPDFEDYIAFAEHLLRGRYGSWLNQPDEMAACTLDNSCTPLIWTAPYELRKATLKFSRTPTPTSLPQDAAMITFHVLNLTDGDPDDTWTDTDYSDAEAQFGTFWQAVDEWYRPETTLTDIVWTADGPAFTPHGESPHPTLRVTSIVLPGTASSGAMLPPQVAATVTEVTPAKYTVTDVEGVGTQIRNRWGRFYMPAPISNAVDAGRLHSDFCDALADATLNLYTSMVEADLPIVMYSPTTGSSWSVDEIHVDDIWDVVRSRRFEGPLNRHVRTLP